MLKQFTLSLAVTSAFALAAPAMAQDIPDEEAFNGVYVGASGGYDAQPTERNPVILFDRNGDGNFNDQVTTAAGANAFSPGFCGGRVRGTAPTAGCFNDHDDASYYGRVGLDKRYGNIVIGALGEFGRTEIRDATSGFSTTPASYTLERSIDWEASGRLRAGYAVGSGLFYATGGVGYAHIKHSFFTSNTANAFTDNGDKEEFGYIVGGGVEKYITRNISIGAEYTFHSYQDNNYRVNVAQGTAPATNPFVLAPNTAGTTLARDDERFSWHSLRGTVAFRF